MNTRTKYEIIEQMVVGTIEQGGRSSQCTDTIPVSPLSPDEYELGKEIILGQYETIALRPDQYITLSQIRGERNTVTDELKESIVRRGMINPPDAALVSWEQLVDYVDFTNSTWGAKIDAEDLAVYQLPNGFFPLIKAGHSRHQATTELIEEGRLPKSTLLVSKISGAESVWDIVQWQIDENIHSQPARERRAMALVESYVYGLRNGDWASEAEFVAIQQAQHHDVTKGPLHQALQYAKLPSRIRNFILSGQIPYLAGVEMGATVEVLTEFVLRTNGYKGAEDSTLTEDDRQRVADIVVMKFDILCNRITEDRLNSTASQKLIQGNRNEWARIVKSMRSGKRQRTDTFEFEFGQDQLDLAYEAQRRELQTQLVGLRRKYSGQDVVHFLKLQKGILPDDDIEQLLADFNESTSHTRERVFVGALATTAANHEFEAGLF